ncbi:hypothetical protein J4Q44_G00071120 [Coregonus suidteri]|uniref:Uncharacterized protein n=1 Tax=Coregonus suidteri TaxID=861788 RepID=A0AAN8M0G6_9TELE
MKQEKTQWKDFLENISVLQWILTFLLLVGAKMALEFGADLMPVYSYGENNIFRQVTFSEGSVGWRLQQLLKKIMGFAPCLFVGEHWFWIPYHCPVTTFESPSVTEV